MKYLYLLTFLVAASCQNSPKSLTVPKSPAGISLIAALDTIWQTEQVPLAKRDSLMKIYGVESAEAKEQQAIYDKNHIINEAKVIAILEKYGWPSEAMIGERGNLTLCNVLQHSDHEVQLKYLPLMKLAVQKQLLEPRLLARTEDRIATERGELQVYGGQMKFYPKTKSFNVWPVVDPKNIDKRRAEIGLGPIAEHLKERFDFEWDLEEQLKRTRNFSKSKEQ